MVSLTETFGGSSTPYEAPLLSDGTLRVLAIAAGILSSPGPVVVIEEIDNGVHPSRAAQLLDQMSRVAKKRNLRVLISSHNPALLDALPDDAVPDVVFCYRDPEDGSSRLTSLSDIPDYPELVAQGTVGHLMTHRIIERFVKERPEPGATKSACACLAERASEAGRVIDRAGHPALVMPPIVIVDTSVLLNVLDVPGFNRDRGTVLDRFEELVDDGANLLLPMGAVFETGNHVAHLPGGQQPPTVCRSAQGPGTTGAGGTGTVDAASVPGCAATRRLAGGLPRLCDPRYWHG